MSRLLAAPEARLAVIAVVVFAALSLLAPDRFLSAQNITSMAFQFPEFAILALAMTITMLTGGIDLSVVGVANLSAIVAALILTRLAAGASGRSVVWLAVAMARRARRRASPPGSSTASRSRSSACRRSSRPSARG